MQKLTKKSKGIIGVRSIWESDIPGLKFSQLNENKSTEVLIIGGGIAGILCAHKLRSMGVDFILLEADEILSGITKSTTAKITLSHGLIYAKMIPQAVSDSLWYLWLE